MVETRKNCQRSCHTGVMVMVEMPIRVLILFIVFAAAATAAAVSGPASPGAGQDFWAHRGDGRAELAG